MSDSDARFGRQKVATSSHTANLLNSPSSRAGIDTPEAEVQENVEVARQALLELSASNPELAATLAKIMTAVATEAARSKRLSQALSKALQPVASNERPGTDVTERRSGRRTPGPFDPFAVFAESGEEGLRVRLSGLSVEQLRDIIAEQRMDHDRLAMKWKDPERLSGRIVERVMTRSVKGEVFRSS